MKKQVKEYVKTCISCQKKKILEMKTRQPMVIADTSIDAFDRAVLDIVGPLLKPQNSNIYILALQDDLTKYCMAAPL